MRFGVFRFRTSPTSAPSTPTATYRLRPSMLSDISRTLFGTAKAHRDQDENVTTSISGLLSSSSFSVRRARSQSTGSLPSRIEGVVAAKADLQMIISGHPSDADLNERLTVARHNSNTLAMTASPIKPHMPHESRATDDSSTAPAAQSLFVPPFKSSASPISLSGFASAGQTTKVSDTSGTKRQHSEDDSTPRKRSPSCEQEILPLASRVSPIPSYIDSRRSSCRSSPRSTIKVTPRRALNSQHSTPPRTPSGRRSRAIAPNKDLAASLQSIRQMVSRQMRLLSAQLILRLRMLELRSNDSSLNCERARSRRL